MKFVSIIIPVKNRRKYLELSLASYLCQSYSPHKFEVIIVDDGSAEEISQHIKPKDWPFAIKLVKNEKTLGPALSRHEGVMASRGEIILFTDSDIIVPADFVAAHAEYHIKKKNIVVSSLYRKRIITFLHPEQTKSKLFKKMLQIYPKLIKRLPPDFNQEQVPVQLFTANDITKGRIWKIGNKLEQKKRAASFLEEYGRELKKCKAPWITFHSYSASLPKSSYYDVGGFDPDVKFRHTDRALAYRLYRKGYHFLCDPNIVPLHQQHPIHPDMKQWMIDSYKNWLQKNPHREIYLFGLRFLSPRFKNDLYYCRLLEQMNEMERMYPSLAAALDKLFFLLAQSLFQPVTEHEIIKSCQQAEQTLAEIGGVDGRFHHSELHESLQIIKSLVSVE
ncbi:hypothetical protein BSNK01_14300 [Bacillaceae bacterium]